MIEKLLDLSDNFPDTGIVAPSLRSLKGFRRRGSPGRYATMALIVSGALGFVIFIAVIASAILSDLPDGGDFPAALAGNLLAGLQWCFLASALSFAFFIYLPVIEEKKRMAAVESGMPFFLRSAGMLIEMGIPYQRSLELACEDDSEAAKAMNGVLEDVKRGAGFPKAFSYLSSSTDSLIMKKAVSQLLSAYVIGSSGKELRRMGDDLLLQESNRLKEHSARCAMFGLLFMVSSAVAPTFFLVYAIMGRTAMGSTISDLQIELGMLVVFPSVSALILVIGKAMTPPSAFKERSGFDFRMIIPGIFFVFGFLLFPGIQVLMMVIGIAISAYLAYSSYGHERRIEEIERDLPDALFSISALPGSVRGERIFSLIREEGHGALSEEAEKTRKQLSMNVRMDDALDDLGKRNDSDLLRYACRMIKQMINTNAIDRINKLAEDMVAAFQIRRERSQMMSMQRYTLMFGALLIPLIMKMTIGLLGAMQGSLGSGLDIGAGAGSDVPGSIALAISIIPPYLILYSLVSSAAIADAEGRKTAGAVYFTGMILVSLATFYFINL